MLGRERRGHAREEGSGQVEQRRPHEQDRQEGEQDLFPEQNLEARHDQENPNTLALLGPRGTLDFPQCGRESQAVLPGYSWESKPCSLEGLGGTRLMADGQALPLPAPQPRVHCDNYTVKAPESMGGSGSKAAGCHHQQSCPGLGGEGKVVTICFHSKGKDRVAPCRSVCSSECDPPPGGGGGGVENGREL